MKAEASGRNIKIKIRQAVVVFQASPGFQLDILDHAHGIDAHQHRFLQMIAVTFSRQACVRESNFTAALKDVHPGFFGPGQIDGGYLQGFGAVKNFIQPIQANHQQQHKNQHGSRAGYAKPFIFRYFHNIGIARRTGMGLTLP